MKICLVDPARSINGDAHLLGLSYLAAALLQIGITPTVTVRDPDESVDDLAVRLSTQSHDLVGITCHTRSFPVVVRLAQAYKSRCPHSLVVLGGMYPTFQHHRILDLYPEAVDAIVRHEGEFTLQEIVHRDADFREIAGVTFRNKDRVIVNPDAATIADLDRLPRPAWHLLPMMSLPVESQGQLLSSRGCPYRCIFCTCAPMFRTYRKHSVKRVLEEMKELHTLYGLEEITFVDDTFTLDRNRTLELCKRIEQERLNLRWNCSSRVDAVDPDMLNRMASAGCCTIFFGVESFSQATLRRVGKGTFPQNNLTAIRWAHSAGLRVKCGIIVGLPGETEESMADALTILRDEGVEEVSPSFVTPAPGSRLYEELEEYNLEILEKDLSRFDYIHPVASLPGWPHDVQKHYFLEFMALNARQSQTFERSRLSS